MSVVKHIERLPSWVPACFLGVGINVRGEFRRSPDRSFLHHLPISRAGIEDIA